ncbi:MAG: OmpA family protein [Kiritimatiellae bacterium]|nr:OmpA family protein [Kiritimatiellia bacterium]
MTDLLANQETPTPKSERLLLVSPQDLLPGPNAPREMSAQPVLVESVKRYGVLEPLLARKKGEDLEVLAGFKRWAAAKEADLESVPVRLYRVEDAAIASFYAASNLQGERRRVSPPGMAPGKSTYKPTGALGGLLEEELNRPPSQTPYLGVFISCVAVILLVLFGMQITRCVRRAPQTDEDFDPVMVDEGTEITETGDRTPADPARPRRGVAEWRTHLGDIDGIEVRDASGTPRIVFQEPVFSRLTTIDPNQTRRLTRVASKIREISPESLIVIIGHTDNDPVRPGGAYASNHELGELRAKEVQQYLTTRARIPETRLRTISSGDESPPFPNTPASSKARNRTVSIEIISPGGS